MRNRTSEIARISAAAPGRLSRAASSGVSSGVDALPMHGRALRRSLTANMRRISSLVRIPFEKKLDVHPALAAIVSLPGVAMCYDFTEEDQEFSKYN